MPTMLLCACCPVLAPPPPSALQPVVPIAGLMCLCPDSTCAHGCCSLAVLPPPLPLPCLPPPLPALQPAVPFAGLFRLIDVPVSNCIHSGISNIYVLTQYNATSLNRHLSRAYQFLNGITFQGMGGRGGRGRRAHGSFFWGGGCGFA